MLMGPIPAIALSGVSKTYRTRDGDVPSLQPIVPAVAGVPENFISPEDFNKYAESSDKIFQDMFR